MWKPLPLANAAIGLRRDVEAIAAGRRAAGCRRVVEAVTAGQRHRWPSPCGGSHHRAMEVVTAL
jgi:hypothetical protein